MTCWSDRNPASTRAELDTLWARVRLEITSIWQTEEHPREGLTVVDEREHVLFYLIDILYRVVPLFYEEIEAALAQRLFEVPVETLDVPNILRFGSWVGGDMDGNADVHGKTIRETLQRHQQLIVSTYFTECGQLAESLSQSANRVERERRAGRAHRRLRRPFCRARRRSRPRATTACRTVCFSARSASGCKATYEGRPNAYQNPDELLADIGLAADSLLENRGRHAGYFLVRRLMRRVRTFGFHLATLDVIQHARVHDEVIAQGLDSEELAGAAAAGAAAAIARFAGARSRSRPRHSMPWAGAACGCSRPSPRRATNSAAAPSASTSSAARAVPKTSWRCCCWRAGRTSPTSAAANVRWMWRRCSSAIDSLETAGDVLRALHRRAGLSAASCTRAPIAKWW